jgi:trimethylamine--corrinoid protein Co-methyltransferase
MTSLAAGLAGANYIHHSAGFLESMVTVAYEQYVIDNEVNGQVMRMLRGIEVTDETLSVDMIDEVCKGPGHFLGHDQTMARMTTEYLYPRLLDRANRTDWEAAGAQDLRQTARARARQILAEHWPTVIAPEADEDLRRRFNILLPREEMRPAD